MTKEKTSIFNNNEMIKYYNKYYTDEKINLVGNGNL